jgi:hypothetical protein
MAGGDGQRNSAPNVSQWTKFRLARGEAASFFSLRSRQGEEGWGGEGNLTVQILFPLARSPGEGVGGEGNARTLSLKNLFSHEGTPKERALVYSPH